MRQACVFVCRGDMCRHGLTTPVRNGKGVVAELPVQKASVFMSNSRLVLGEICLDCPNRDESKPERHHEHCHLLNGRARDVEDYTRKFVKRVMRGVTKELKAVGAISSLEVGVTCEEPELLLREE